MEKTYILEQLKKRANEFYLSTKFEVFAVFAFGSVNYGLTDENSDIDYRLVYFLPRKDFHKQGAIEGFEDEKGNYVECMDIKTFFYNISILDLMALENLATEYSYVNEKYSENWLSLTRIANEILHCNDKIFIKTFLNKVKTSSDYVEKGFGDPEILKRDGYSGKLIHYVLRFEEIWKRFEQKEDIKKIFLSSDKKLMLALKRNLLKKDEAIMLYNTSKFKISWYIQNYKPKKEDYPTQILIQNIFSNIVDKYMLN